MTAKLKTYDLAYKIGIICSLLYFSLDCVVYPQVKWQILLIRVVSALFLGFMYWLTISSDDDRRHRLCMLFSALVTSLGISLMCRVSGEGLASPYYAGQFMLISAITVFIDFKPRYFALIVLGISVQHFLVLAGTLWTLKGIFTTLYFLGGVSTIGLLVHNVIYRLTQEVATLKGFLPICAKCKKIRDDKGYWNQLESYIKSRAQVEFTHGLCPQCAKDFYEFGGHIT